MPDCFCRITVDTVRTQFVYELQGDRYLNPDVVADLTRIDMNQVGSDKVEVKGVKGASCIATSFKCLANCAC